MTSNATSFSFGRWTLVGALLAALGALLAHEVTTRRAYAASLQAMSTVTDDTLPTLLHLTELRRVIRDLDIELALGPELAASPRVQAQIERSWPVIDAHVEAYTQLPALPAERPLRAHLLVGLEGLRAAERALLAAPDDASARAALREQVVPAAREVRVLTDAIATLNAQEAADAAQEVLHAHDRAGDFSRLLLMALAALIVVSGGAAYAAVARAERATRATVEELDAFAGRVAHDLKAPLQPATLAVDVLRREDGLSAAGARALERLERSVRRSGALIDGLLAFARSGAQPARDARSDLGEVALELEPAWRQLAASLDARLDVDLQPRIELAASHTVVASILDNLTRNALQYLDASAQRVVTVRAREEQGAAVLAVTDSGPGIPSDLLARLFRPFERGGDQPGGSGLGLAIVKRLVDTHGGTVEVTSSLGQGSTFRVTLPLAGSPRVTSRG